MRNARGFTLVEVMLAMLLMTMGVLAAAPLFVQAIQTNASGADHGTVGAAAVARLEWLRTVNFKNSLMAAGGSLTSDVTDYFDDATPGVHVRWQITNNASPPNTKTIVVRAVATRQVVGRPKQVTLATVRGK